MKTNYQLTKVTETPRPATVIALDDDDRAVLGITAPHEDHEPADVSHAELTARYQKRCRLTLADAQNRAAATLAKLRPAPRRVVHAAPKFETVTFAVPAQPAPIADAQPDEMHRLTDFFRKSGYDFETAQQFALRQLSDPTFNPPRDAEYMSEPARQEYANCIAELTALLQPAGAEGRDALIRALGNGNLLATLTAVANGWIQNLAVCQTWAQRIVGQLHVGGAWSYDAARAQAEKLTTELAAASDRTPDRLSTGIVVPQIASRSANRAAPTAGPLTAGAAPVDQTAPMRAMQAADPVSDSFFRAKAFAAAARTSRGGR